MCKHRAGTQFWILQHLLCNLNYPPVLIFVITRLMKWKDTHPSNSNNKMDSEKLNIQHFNHSLVTNKLVSLNYHQQGHYYSYLCMSLCCFNNLGDSSSGNRARDIYLTLYSAIAGSHLAFSFKMQLKRNHICKCPWRRGCRGWLI